MRQQQVYSESSFLREETTDFLYLYFYPDALGRLKSWCLSVLPQGSPGSRGRQKLEERGGQGEKRFGAWHGIPTPYPDIYFFFILGKMEWRREGRREGEVTGTGKHITAECN